MHLRDLDTGAESSFEVPGHSIHRLFSNGDELALDAYPEDGDNSYHTLVVRADGTLLADVSLFEESAIVGMSDRYATLTNHVFDLRTHRLLRVSDLNGISSVWPQSGGSTVVWSGGTQHDPERKVVVARMLR